MTRFQKAMYYWGWLNLVAFVINFIRSFQQSFNTALHGDDLDAWDRLEDSLPEEGDDTLPHIQKGDRIWVTDVFTEGHPRVQARVLEATPHAIFSIPVEEEREKADTLDHLEQWDWNQNQTP